MLKRIGIIKIIGVIFLLLGIGSAFFHFYPETWLFNKIIDAFYANLSAEFISISITILLINYLYELKEKNNLKNRLIRELGSEEKGISASALLELRENGWLNDGTLKNVKLVNAQLTNLDFSGANLEGVNFNNADLSDANFTEANLANATFCDAIMENTNLEEAKLNHCKFHGAQLQEAILNKVDSKDIDFMNANIRESEFFDCTLTNCKFEDATLILANFTRSKVKESNLLRADVHSANIKNAVFERCDINSLKNWEHLVDRSIDSFLAPTNPPEGFLNNNTGSDE